MTTFYICAGIGVITICAVSYALGHRDGRIDGYAEHEDLCRRGGRCAK